MGVVKKIERESLDFAYEGFCMVWVALSDLFEEFEKHSIEDLKSRIAIICDSQKIVLESFECHASNKCKNNVENGNYEHALEYNEYLNDIADLISLDVD